MNRPTIFIADNDPEFLSTRAEFLEAKGYRVIRAATYEDACQKMEQGNYDLAVLDIRLIDDEDSTDMSGLDLAIHSPRAIPIIIQTGYPSLEYLREVLRDKAKNNLPIVDFITREVGGWGLLDAIQKALSTQHSLASVGGHRLKPQSSIELLADYSTEIKKDYEEIRRQCQQTHYARFTLVVVGILFMLAGLVGHLTSQSQVNILIASLGIATEGMAISLKDWDEKKEKRMDIYHKELLELLRRAELEDNKLN